MIACKVHISFSHLLFKIMLFSFLINILKGIFLLPSILSKFCISALAFEHNTLKDIT